MSKSLIIGLVVSATVLAATLLREPIAYAAQTVDAVIVGPLDGQGNVKVHEQGIARVREQGVVDVRSAGSPLVVRLASGGDTAYAVPAGKRFVVEYVNGVIDGSQGPLGLRLTSPFHLFSFAGAEIVAAGPRYVSEPVTIVADDGQVQLQSQLSLLELSGYLVDD